MNYQNGIQAHVGDLIKIDGHPGVIVFIIDSGEYSKDFPEKEWAYLEKGMMIKSEKLGLVHQEELDEDIEFVERGRI